MRVNRAGWTIWLVRPQIYRYIIRDMCTRGRETRDRVGGRARERHRRRAAAQGIL